MKTPATKPRYRVENGRRCIDLRLKSPRHLFDGRDPAPFRERALDDGAVDYILSSVAEVGTSLPLTLVVIFDEADPQLPDDVVLDAIREHLRYEFERAQARLATHWQRTRYLLAVGLSVLALFLALAEFLAKRLDDGPLRQISREGLVITGWVAMWRPLEALLYDWWPLLRAKRLLVQVLGANLELRVNGRALSALPAPAAGS